MSETSIPVSTTMRAFAVGVSAGEEAVAKLAAMTAGTPAERLAFYWLSCGAALASRMPEADEEHQQAFIGGAASRAPSNPPLTLTISTIEGAAFGNLGEDFDEDTCREEIARIVRAAATKITEGFDEGPLRDINGNTVGSFKFDAWST